MIGKVGPVVQVIVLIHHQILKFPLFKRINNYPYVKKSIMVCAAGLSMAVSFQTPTAGVLFGLELAGSYYSIQNYIRSFYVSILGVMVVKLISSAIAGRGLIKYKIF